MQGSLRLLALGAALALLAAACTTETAQTTAGPTETTAGPTETTAAPPAGGTLAAVQARGTLRCGTHDTFPGFGIQNPDGTFSGFDIDYCRAIAAAVLGSGEAAEFRPVAVGERFTALQAGEFDVLVRNTTWTAIRDGSEGVTFVATTYYDGQGMMVRADSGFTTVEDLANTAICVLGETTTELNLADRMVGIPYTPLTFADNPTLQAAFLAGQCDGWTSDKGQLGGFRSAWPEEEGGPAALTILEETFSKEPLGPAVRDGDSQWAQIVAWVVFATIQAEEFGISQGSAGTYGGDDVAIKRFLGQPIPTAEGTEAVFDPGLGLPTDFAVQVIDQVGNYADIYNRHLGPDTPLGLVRTINALWTDGGLLYAPPYR